MLVLQATASGMAYGILESVDYVVRMSKTSVTAGIHQAVLRGLVATPGHAMLGYLSGCCYVSAYLNESKCLFICSIWRSVLAHMFWNSVCFAQMMIGPHVGASKSMMQWISAGLCVIFTVLLGCFCRSHFRALKTQFEEMTTDTEEGHVSYGHYATLEGHAGHTQY